MDAVRSQPAKPEPKASEAPKPAAPQENRYRNDFFGR